jgi:prepilin-type N-terminal cleavage/methylation domain-containing protein
MLPRVPDAEREDGVTLIELLVAIVILGTAVITLTGAMSSLLLATQHHRGQGATDTVLRGYGEAIKSKAKLAANYPQCPTAAQLTPTFTDYDPLVFNPPVISAPVEYWIPTSGDPRTGSFSSDRGDCTNYYGSNGCTSTQLECDPGLQRVTIQVTGKAANLRGGQTSTQILVRRTNAHAS